MKHVALSLLMIFSFIFVDAQSIEFDSKVIDYGVIDHNSDGTIKFFFRQTHRDDLQLLSNYQIGFGLNRYQSSILKDAECSLHFTIN